MTVWDWATVFIATAGASVCIGIFAHAVWWNRRHLAGIRRPYTATNLGSGESREFYDLEAAMSWLREDE